MTQSSPGWAIAQATQLEYVPSWTAFCRSSSLPFAAASSARAEATDSQCALRLATAGADTLGVASAVEAYVEGTAVVMVCMDAAGGKGATGATATAVVCKDTSGRAEAIGAGSAAGTGAAGIAAAEVRNEAASGAADAVDDVVRTTDAVPTGIALGSDVARTTTAEGGTAAGDAGLGTFTDTLEASDA